MRKQKTCAVILDSKLESKNSSMAFVQGAAHAGSSHRNGIVGKCIGYKKAILLDSAQTLTETPFGTDTLSTTQQTNPLEQPPTLHHCFTPQQTKLNSNQNRRSRLQAPELHFYVDYL